MCRHNGKNSVIKEKVKYKKEINGPYRLRELKSVLAMNTPGGSQICLYHL